jgi:hypothetical protein
MAKQRCQITKQPCKMTKQRYKITTPACLTVKRTCLPNRTDERFVVSVSYAAQASIHAALSPAQTSLATLQAHQTDQCPDPSTHQRASNQSAISLK